MAEWSVKPEWKKSIIERNYYHKDGNTVMIETGWRWGEFLVYTEDDNPPDIEAGVDIYNCDYDTELVETEDGCWEEHDMDECDEETQEWLEEFFEENSWLDLEEHGWVQGDCEMIIDCDLIIERVDVEDGQVIHTGSSEEDILNELDSLSENAADAPAKWPFSRPHEGPAENAKFKCTNCDFETEDIMELVDNPNDDDKGALLCPECNSKVDLS